MTGFLLQSAMFQAAQGEEVLVVVSTAADIPELLSGMGADELVPSVRVRRANGDQFIRFPGLGRVRFLTVRSVLRGGLRGATVHHVYLPFNERGDDHLAVELMPALNGRKGVSLTYSADIR